LNREHSIPYKQVLKIFHATQGFVSYHELAPHEESLNQIMDELGACHVSKIIKIPIDSIKHSYQLCLHSEDFSQPSFYEIKNAILKQPLLIDENYFLLSCDCQLRLHQKLGDKYVFARIIRGEGN